MLPVKYERLKVGVLYIFLFIGLVNYEYLII